MPISQQLIQAEIQRRKDEKEIVRCQTDRYYWLTHYVWTLDPHDKQNPIKLFPDKEYLEAITKIWGEEKLLLIEKSRQMLATWLLCALSLHEVQFENGKYDFFQSKKEEDANALVDRAKFIFHHQPEFLKQPIEDTYCKLKFPKKNSQIIGIPQGGDQIRMHTASRVFSDEMGFQSESEEAFTAARPCIEGGGAFVGVSSANPGFFQELCEEEGEWAEIRSGLSKKYTPTGFCVVKLHYTADPIKAMPEWKEAARKGFKHEDKWQKEYEIDFTALGGTNVYPELDEIGKDIFIEPIEIKDYWLRYIGIDPGVRNPTSAHFYAIDEQGNVYAYWELYEKEIHYKDLVRILKEQPDFEKAKRNIYIDPITATKVHHTPLGIKSFKELLEQEGIYTIPGNRDRISGAEKIREYLKDGKIKIFKTCPKLFEELEGLRYEEWTGNRAFEKNTREEIVARNDHAWSELRYVLMSNPFKARRPIPDVEARIKKMLQEREGAISEHYTVDGNPIFSPDDIIITKPKTAREKMEGQAISDFYRI